MNHCRKLLASVLAAVLLLSMFPVSVFAQENTEGSKNPYAEWTAEELFEKYMELKATGDEEAVEAFRKALTEAQLAELDALIEAAEKAATPAPQPNPTEEEDPPADGEKQEETPDVPEKTGEPEEETKEEPEETGEPEDPEKTVETEEPEEKDAEEEAEEEEPAEELLRLLT